jgi:hypothetical protein
VCEIAHTRDASEFGDASGIWLEYRLGVRLEIPDLFPDLIA